MRRSTLFIIIGLVLIAVVAGGVALYKKTTTSNTPNAKLPVVAGNTNETSVSTPPVVKGDIAVNQSVTYRDVPFAIDTALKTTAFHRVKASTDTTFLVLFMKPFVTAPATDPLAWASQDIRLTASTGTPIVPHEISLPTSAKVTGGYLWFYVPTGAKNFVLTFGTGTLKQTLMLGF